MGAGAEAGLGLGVGWVGAGLVCLGVVAVAEMVGFDGGTASSSLTTK